MVQFCIFVDPTARSCHQPFAQYHQCISLCIGHVIPPAVTGLLIWWGEGWLPICQKASTYDPLHAVQIYFW